MKKANSLPITNAIYIHYKNPEPRYLVEDIVKLESTGEWMVVYKNMETKERWVRSNHEFMEIIENDQCELVRRFKYF